MSKYGYKNNIKWVLIRLAPLTASGLNEILAGGETKALVQAFAGDMGIMPTPRRGYDIVKLEDLRREGDGTNPAG